MENDALIRYGNSSQAWMYPNPSVGLSAWQAELLGTVFLPGLFCR